MALTKAWASYFRSGIRMRGRQYQTQGRVHQLPPKSGELVRATVKGSRDYTVIIRADAGTGAASCTCPFFAGGQFCKHIWSVLVDVERNGLLSERTTTAPRPNGATGQPSLDSAVPQPPKARKREPGEKRPLAAREPEWMGRLSLLRYAAADSAETAPTASLMARQVCYVVQVDLSLSSEGLAVELNQRHLTRTGWGALKPFKLTAAQLAGLSDPEDRALCALVLGGRPWHEFDALDNGKPQETYVLPAGARRDLLQRMIRTGRCFISGDEAERGSEDARPAPLQWDGQAGPWVLWLAGTDTGDGFLFNLELRRGEERLTITEPRLLLGGNDGLVFYGDKVAPYEERDAAHWAEQFRTGLRLGEATPGLRVPVEDLERFLDRLYLMPNLPEIDLPEGLGRTEKHLTPAPHLELFSPTSSAAATLLGGTLPRNLLLGRLWFAYGAQTVMPGTPGRFVTTETVASDDPTPRPTSATTAQEISDSDNRISDGEENTSEAEAPPETMPGTVPGVPGGTVAGIPGGELIRRNLRAENEALGLLVGLGFRPDPAATGDQGLGGMLPVKLMPAVVGQLIPRGWVVTADRRTVQTATRPSFSINASGVDWFELHGGLKFTRADGTEELVGLPAVLEAARQGRAMVELSDGSQGILPEEWLKQHGLLAAIGQAEGDHLRFRASQAALLDALLESHELEQVDEAYARIRHRLKHFEGVHPLDPPAQFAGALRPYQRDGLGWLKFLREFGMGGILADDMGLGKTIQVLAMLQAQTHAADPAAAQLPSLVVAPRSVVFNWLDEAARFTPELKVHAYTGAEREAQRESFTRHDLIVTTYGLMRRDIAELAKHSFHYVILDEAQAIKNPSSQVAKAARLLPARHRLALTGTPVENHLGDLWSIFEYLNPGILGGAGGFMRLIQQSVQTGRNDNNNSPAETPSPAVPALDPALDPQANPLAAKNLQSAEVALQIGRALRPFILRRTKKQVLRDLPEKTEQTILCAMEGPQRQAYQELLTHYRASLLKKVDAQGLGRNTMMVLEALLRLRQAACHPGLIDPQRVDEPSAKLDALFEQVEDLIAEGHKALIFSQFTSFLAIVRKQLDARGIAYEYLDGQTRQRKQHVVRFQTDPKCPLFLISLKAGGLGLNLTAAEYVFILDPWWNPAVENQAIDRAHRIGQTRHVFAYRLICEDTVEQRIADLQVKKRTLADAIVGEQESLLQTLTREDLERLLS